MPILHGVFASPYVRKVRVVCAEKNVDYESNPLIPFGPNEEYRKISPLGKIPCWQDGDFSLPDSSCIIAFLEDTHPANPVYPSDPHEKARALWLEEYSDTKLAETTGTIFQQRYLNPNFFQKEVDEALVAQKLEELAPLCDYLTEQLGGRDWLVGSSFSVADVAVGANFVNLAMGGEKPDASRWPALATYVARVHARPSFAKCLADEGFQPA